MQSHFDVSAVKPNTPTSAPANLDASAHLLHQILEVQRQILAQLQATAAAQDPTTRWKSLLARWSDRYPELSQGCQHALPVLENAYGAIIAEMVEELRDSGEDALDNDFALQEFLDRYGIRLGQLGNILNLVGPLAEAGSQKKSS